MLEGAVDDTKENFGRMDKLGNACTIAATLLHADDHVCADAQNACRGHEDSGLVRVGDPWCSGKYVDITCPKFVALACGEGRRRAPLPSARRGLEASAEVGRLSLGRELCASGGAADGGAERSRPSSVRA